MLSKTSNLSIEYGNIDDDSIIQECNSQILNSNEFSPTDFKLFVQNDLRGYYKISFNNNYSEPSLLNINYNNEKELEYLINQNKLINDNKIMISKGKDMEKNFYSLINITKKYPFITNHVSYNKELNNNLSKGKNQKGRKKKDDESIREHNKCSDDNLIRKCKHLVLKNFIDFINEKIEKLYNGKIGNSIFKKKFLTFNKKQKAESSTNYNKNFLTKKLKDICSDKISNRFTNYVKDHNKNLITVLLNEEDEEKRIYFQKLFDKTFFDCLNHFRGSNSIEEFKGMKCFNEVKEEFKDDKEYMNIINFYLNNYEDIINRKKARNSRKNQNK